MLPWERRVDEIELVLICRDVSGSSLLELELIVYIEDNFYTCTFVQQKNEFRDSNDNFFDYLNASTVY